MTALSWIGENREWLFSGLGVVVLSAFGAWLFKRRSPAQAATTIDPLLNPMQGTENMSLPKPHCFWRALQHVPGLRRTAWKKIYSEPRLNQEIRIGVRGDGEGIDVYRNGNEGHVRVWLDVVNMLPFPVEIDRITGALTVSGAVVAEINSVDRHTLKARRWGDVFFQFSLSSSQLEAIALQRQNRPDARAGMRIRVYLQSNVRNVSLDRQIESGNCRFTNFRKT